MTLICLVVASFLCISGTRALQSDEQCYNVTCEALAYPECLRTSENDKTITFNTIYCNNGKQEGITRG